VPPGAAHTPLATPVVDALFVGVGEASTDSTPVWCKEKSTQGELGRGARTCSGLSIDVKKRSNKNLKR